jgi:DNA ligase-1
MDIEVNRQSNVNPDSFLSFARTCEKIRSTASKLEKVDILANYLSSLRDDEDLRIAATLLSGRIFSPGSQEQEVNIGYSIIWRVLSSSFELNDNDLSKYYLKHGDLGSVAEEIFENKKLRPGSSLFAFGNNDAESHLFSLKDLYSAFRELARATGHNSIERKAQILKRIILLIREPVEVKYLVRILSGEMRIGLVEGLLEEGIAKSSATTLGEVRSANLVSGSIALVAVLARHNDLGSAKIEVMRPTNFMLADTAEDAAHLFEKFESMPVYSEFKYDGIRAQLHKEGDVIKIFSRNLADVTRFFPELENAAKNIRAGNLILDGEILAHDGKAPLSFQLLQRRLRKKARSSSDVPIRYFAFDILLCDSSFLTGEPLKKRVEILDALGLHAPLARSNQKSVSSVEEIAEMFAESRSLGYEGLVVKDPNSSYTPGRRGRSWVKLKKELDTLDVVIVEAEYGHGKRAGVISDYTFAVNDGDDLKVVGKAYSGLTDLEIQEMTKLLKEITLKDYGYRRLVKPQVVLEVAFDAIQKSDRHDSGFALRFPRIKRIRNDKSVEDIDTLDRVRKIYEAQRVRV